MNLTRGSLRFQIGTLKKSRGQHRKYLPNVFTEQGVAMLSGVLKSKRAVQVNVAIMRTFVKLREMIASNKELAKRLKGKVRTIYFDPFYGIKFEQRLCER